jgi:hypothetical protein
MKHKQFSLTVKYNTQHVYIDNQDKRIEHVITLYCIILFHITSYKILLI